MSQSSDAHLCGNTQKSSPTFDIHQGCSSPCPSWLLNVHSGLFCIKLKPIVQFRFSVWRKDGFRKSCNKKISALCQLAATHLEQNKKCQLFKMIWILKQGHYFPVFWVHLQRYNNNKNIYFPKIFNKIIKHQGYILIWKGP